MITTLDLDPIILEAARQFAQERHQPLDIAISELILQGLRLERRTVRRAGFPVFLAPAGAKRISLADVRLVEHEH